MMTQHFIIKCEKCDTVVTQCRCPSHDKVVSYTVCEKCSKDSKDKKE